MKRLLLLLALCLILTAPVMAAPLTFQTQGEISRFTTNNTGGGTCAPKEESYTSYSGNHYSFLRCLGDGVIFINTSLPTTYAAATWVYVSSGSWQQYRVVLFDANKAVLYSYSSEAVALYANHRIEVNITGSTARIYRDGILIATSSSLAQNPSYVGFGGGGYSGAGDTYWDDFVYGAESEKWAFGIPMQNEFVILKDITTPAKRGVYYENETTLVSSYNLSSTWSRGVDNTSAVVGLYLEGDATPVCTFNTTTGTSTGSYSWPLEECLFNNPDARYGLYYVSTPGTISQSEFIVYRGGGASVAFDREDYVQQDTATITYSVIGSAWDTSTYTYSMKIYSGNDWSVVDTEEISASSGTYTYQFTSDDEQGEYYAALVAVPNAGGEEIWMNYDYAALTAYAQFSGYVNDAETGLPISGANVSFSQNDIISNSITIADGNYTATGFMTGATLVINVTATGHSQYYASLIPMVAKSIPLNITLNSTTPSYAGLGIGGIHRDGILTGTLITSGYGRPIAGATAHLGNATYGPSCSNTSNNVGWYLFDEGNSCILTTGRLYDVWSEKLGYSNSPNYTAVAA